MKDNIHRNIDYIRISLTDHCNLRCCYCMPESQKDFLNTTELMTREELVTITRLMAKNGISKIKLTGGEPLLRQDLTEIVRELKAINGIEQITLTTNGILLKDRLKELVEAGISSVNISIDTRNPEKYREITKRDGFSQVWEGLMEAIKYPELSVKVNCVPIDCSRENIRDMVELARDNKLSVRFIEMMPIGYGVNYQLCNEEHIKNILDQEYGALRPVNKRIGNGPARYYEIEGFQGRIGFISAVSHKFCSDCNRIRLTAEGLLKTCLQYGGKLNLKELLRQGVTEEELEGLIKGEVMRKPCGHHFYEHGTDMDEKKYLGAIGG
jgi:GTP 3',8-cyclase